MHDAHTLPFIMNQVPLIVPSFLIVLSLLTCECLVLLNLHQTNVRTTYFLASLGLITKLSLSNQKLLIFMLITPHRMHDSILRVTVDRHHLSPRFFL